MGKAAVKLFTNGSHIEVLQVYVYGIGLIVGDQKFKPRNQFQFACLDLK